MIPVRSLLLLSVSVLGINLLTSGKAGAQTLTNFTYDSAFVAGGALTYKKAAEYSVGLNQTLQTSPNLLTAWSLSGNGGAILVGASNAMNASGRITRFTIRVRPFGTNDYAVYDTGPAAGSGEAVAFRIDNIQQVGTAVPPTFKGRLLRFNSTNPDRGWNFSVPAGSAGNSFKRLIDAAEAASTVLGFIYVDNSMPVLAQMETYNSATGANGTFGILISGEAAEPLGDPETPPPSDGNLIPSKRYQRYDADITFDAYVTTSSRMNLVGGTYNALFPTPAEDSDRRIPSSGYREFNIPMASYIGANGSLQFILKAQGRSNNGTGTLGNFINVDNETVYRYTPYMSQFSVTTRDAYARSGSTNRTRVDVPFDLVVEPLGFLTQGGDPGDQSISLFLTRNAATNPVWALRSDFLPIGYYTSIANALASSTVYGVMYNADGDLMGLPANRTTSYSWLPESSCQGALSSNAVITGTFTAGLRAVKHSGANKNAILASTAKVWPGVVTPSVEVYPLAAGSAQFGGSGAIAFAQPSRNAEGAAGVITSNVTLTTSNVTLSLSITNPYPGSYTALMIAPSEFSTPNSAAGQVGSNYPSGTTTITADLSSYLNQKPNGWYNLYIMNYNPVDDQSLAAASSDARLGAIGATFTGNNPSVDGAVNWTPPGSGSAFPYGWSRLGTIQFYYNGPITVSNIGIVTDQ